MCGAMDALQIKEGVPQCFATETHLGSTNVDFHIEQFTSESKSDGILHHQSEENREEASSGSSCHGYQ